VPTGKTSFAVAWKRDDLLQAERNPPPLKARGDSPISVDDPFSYRRSCVCCRLRFFHVMRLVYTRTRSPLSFCYPPLRTRAPRQSPPFLSLRALSASPRHWVFFCPGPPSLPSATDTVNTGPFPVDCSSETVETFCWTVFP